MKVDEDDVDAADDLCRSMFPYSHVAALYAVPSGNLT
jgi:hypothetical protein